jgi:mannose-1-phosphate guanylyltransferase
MLEVTARDWDSFKALNLTERVRDSLALPSGDNAAGAVVKALQSQLNALSALVPDSAAHYFNVASATGNEAESGKTLTSRERTAVSFLVRRASKAGAMFSVFKSYFAIRLRAAEPHDAAAARAAFDAAFSTRPDLARQREHFAPFLNDAKTRLRGPPALTGVVRPKPDSHATRALTLRLDVENDPVEILHLAASDVAGSCLTLEGGHFEQHLPGYLMNLHFAVVFLRDAATGRPVGRVSLALDPERRVLFAVSKVMTHQTEYDFTPLVGAYVRQWADQANVTAVLPHATEWQNDHEHQGLNYTQRPGDDWSSGRVEVSITGLTDSFHSDLTETVYGAWSGVVKGWVYRPKPKAEVDTAAMSKVHAVLMAGGMSSRLWPLQKIFSDPTGAGRSLLQQAFDRVSAAAFGPFVRPENFHVATGHGFEDGVAAQLAVDGGMRRENIGAEPDRRGTLGAMLWAMAHVRRTEEDATLLLLSADQVIPNVDAFRETVQDAVVAAQDHPAIVTIGIDPTTRPADWVGFGAIKARLRDPGVVETLHAVERFEEKPTAGRAAEMIGEAQHARVARWYWNSGMFVARISTLEAALRAFQPEIHAIYEKIAAAVAAGDEDEAARLFETLPSKIPHPLTRDPVDSSIDYALMMPLTLFPRADLEAYMAPGRFSWQDLGSWDALRTAVPPDDDDNVLIGNVRTRRAVTHSTVLAEPGKRIIVEGPLEGLAIVLGADGRALVAAENRAQDVKRIAQGLAGAAPGAARAELIDAEGTLVDAPESVVGVLGVRNLDISLHNDTLTVRPRPFITEVSAGGLHAAVFSMFDRQRRVGFVKRLQGVVLRPLEGTGLLVQENFGRDPAKRSAIPGLPNSVDPERMARIEGLALRSAPDGDRCPLCLPTRSQLEEALLWGRFLISPNAYPVADDHGVFVSRDHQPQVVRAAELAEILNAVWDMPEFVFYFAGPGGGPSVPGHTHYNFFRRTPRDAAVPGAAVRFPIEDVRGRPAPVADAPDLTVTRFRPPEYQARGYMIEGPLRARVRIAELAVAIADQWASEKTPLGNDVIMVRDGRRLRLWIFARAREKAGIKIVGPIEMGGVWVASTQAELELARFFPRILGIVTVPESVMERTEAHFRRSGTVHFSKGLLFGPTGVPLLDDVVLPLAEEIGFTAIPALAGSLGVFSLARLAFVAGHAIRTKPAEAPWVRHLAGRLTVPFLLSASLITVALAVRAVGVELFFAGRWPVALAAAWAAHMFFNRVVQPALERWRGEPARAPAAPAERSQRGWEKKRAAWRRAARGA